MDRISKHISYHEATKSATAKRFGLDNTPNEDQLQAMKFTAEKLFEPLRAYIGKPINVTSMFRSLIVNQKIGGSKTSQHMKGEAMDLVHYSSEANNKTIFDFFYSEGIEFDQLIWEFGTKDCPDWVHVSIRRDGKNRGQVLRVYRVDGRSKYVPFDLY